MSASTLSYISGAIGTSSLSSEALPNALPVGQNSPQICPYSLYAEQISGTAFTAPRSENIRSWLYKVRPSAMHGPFKRISDGLLDLMALRPFAMADIPEVAAELAAAVAAGAMPWHGGRWVLRQAVPWVETESVGELPVNLDGEPMKARHFRFEAIPGAVRRVLPVDCPCL